MASDNVIQDNSIKNNAIKDVVILGSGPAGLTAAVYTGRANLNPLVIQGFMPGGQLTTTTEVENFPGFSNGILGPDLMNEMQLQAKRFGAEFVTEEATKVSFGSANNTHSIWLGDTEVKTKCLIIATGATARTLGAENEATLMGFGLSTCATCDGAFFQDKEIVVIGGGDSACEEAMFLTRFGSRVRIVHRREEFRASKIMVERTINHPKIEVLWNNQLVKLLGDRKSGLTGCILKNPKTEQETQISCDAVFYAIGHTPNTKLFKGLLDMDENEYLITKPNSTETKIPGVFACGDVKDHIFRQAITAAASGCMAAIEVERYLATA